MFSMGHPAQQLELTGLCGPNQGDALTERNDVEYVHMRTRSVLNWVDGRHMQRVYSLNPYRGCEIGCTYCYARYTHDFLGELEDDAFERRIYIKTDAPVRLRRELTRKAVHRHGLAIGTATDPYQPAERIFRVTRRVLEELLPHRGLPISIVTKSTLIRRDVVLLSELAKRHTLTVGMSFTSMDETLVRAMEPRAPTPLARFKTMEALARAGIRVSLFLMPIIPGLTDDDENLEELIVRAARAGAVAVASNVLWLSASARKHFFPWLERTHPELYQRLRAAYAGGMYQSAAQRRRLQWRVQTLAVRHGFS